MTASSRDCIVTFINGLEVCIVAFDDDDVGLVFDKDGNFRVRVFANCFHGGVWV